MPSPHPIRFNTYLKYLFGFKHIVYDFKSFKIHLSYVQYILYHFIYIVPNPRPPLPREIERGRPPKLWIFGFWEPLIWHFLFYVWRLEVWFLYLKTIACVDISQQTTNNQHRIGLTMGGSIINQVAKYNMYIYIYIYTYGSRTLITCILRGAWTRIIWICWMLALFPL